MFNPIIDISVWLNWVVTLSFLEVHNEIYQNGQYSVIYSVTCCNTSQLVLRFLCCPDTPPGVCCNTTYRAIFKMVLVTASWWLALVVY